MFPSIAGRYLVTLAFAGGALALAACRPSRKPNRDDRKKGDGKPDTPPVPDNKPLPPLPEGRQVYPHLDIPMSDQTMRIFAAANRVESSVYDTDGNYLGVHTSVRQIPYLNDGANHLVSRFFDVTGQTALSGKYDQQPFKVGERYVTQDGFDQSMAYYSLHMLVGSMAVHGYPIDKMFANGPTTVKANAMNDLNAFFNPQQNVIQFGKGVRNGVEMFHTAGDGDIPSHEGSHKTLHVQMPNLLSPFGGVGGGIHEGNSDGQSALLTLLGDSELSEDFPRAIDKPEGTNKGLRLLRNDLTMKNAGSEVHAMGRVFGGFEWSLFETHLTPIVGRAQARSLAFELVINHALNYGGSSSIQAKDFVDAFRKTAAALDRSGRLPEGIKLGQIVEAIQKEGDRRKMMEAGGGGGKFPWPWVVGADRLTADHIDPYHDDKKIDDILARHRKASDGAMLFSGDEDVGVLTKAVHTAESAVNKTVTYQQYYALKSPALESRYGNAEVMSHTVIHRMDAAGRTLDIHEDVRSIDRGGNDINETLQLTEGEAILMAQRKVNAEISRLGDIEKEKLSKNEELSTDENLLRVSLKACHEKTQYQKRMLVNSEGNLKAIPVKLVIVPGRNTLSYEVELSHGTVYIPAHKKEVNPSDVTFWSHMIQ